MASSESKVKSIPSAGFRVTVSAVIGLIVAGFVGSYLGWRYAPIAAWDTAALVFLVWVWDQLHNLNAADTAKLAVREDPGRTGADTLLVLASVASLAAVVALLSEAGNTTGGGELFLASLCIVSVVISWSTVHTVYALRYARFFYNTKGMAADFNDGKDPCFSDFAYLAFTVGMTFQVSDTILKNNELRRIALRHALLAYVFGTVIVASTISLITGLQK